MTDLIDAWTEEEVASGEVVLRQGYRDEGKFYVVQSGELEVLVSRDGKEPVRFAACAGRRFV
jgi:CRP-like cAMP-binding protein